MRRYYERLLYEQQVAPRRRQFYRLLARQVEAIKKASRSKESCDEGLASYY